jgi:hypothetical protein
LQVVRTVAILGHYAKEIARPGYCSREAALSDNVIKQRANAQFRKLPGVEGGTTATSEYEAGAAAVAAKTARLKELRLARDAAVAAAPPQAVATKKAGRKKKRPVSPAASLADWLKNRQAAR